MPKTSYIIFDDWEIRAIRSGLKTQCRKIFQRFINANSKGKSIMGGNILKANSRSFTRYEKVKCLWVKEWWGYMPIDGKGIIPVYRADQSVDESGLCGKKWLSPSSMTRSQSRLSLTVLGAKIDLLHNITPDDCFREGIRVYDRNTVCQPINCPQLYLSSYTTHWNSVYGTGSQNYWGNEWGLNPYVWVIDFNLTN